ncbi:MAG: SDR family NAD(P)-dependent oxidoreductase, partial [Gammaproteobacteria bacterium]|nr:SDR family NAD(P)-dependent oxidoreductase [Gammaproteobacteria bacterium]
MSDRPESPDDASRRHFIVGAALTGLALSATALCATAGNRGCRHGAAATGKVVLITGATSGIGEATAHAYAREGARIFFCGRREERGRQVEKAIRDSGGDATYMRADVREEAQVAAFVAR